MMIYVKPYQKNGQEIKIVNNQIIIFSNPSLIQSGTLVFSVIESMSVQTVVWVADQHIFPS